MPSKTSVKHYPGRFSGSWIVLLATPSHPSMNSGQWHFVWLSSPLTAAGPRRPFTVFPLPKHVPLLNPLYNPEQFSCQYLFRLDFPDFSRVTPLFPSAICWLGKRYCTTDTKAMVGVGRNGNVWACLSAMHSTRQLSGTGRLNRTNDFSFKKSLDVFAFSTLFSFT